MISQHLLILVLIYRIRSSISYSICEELWGVILECGTRPDCTLGEFLIFKVNERNTALTRKPAVISLLLFIIIARLSLSFLISRKIPVFYWYTWRRHVVVSRFIIARHHLYQNSHSLTLSCLAALSVCLRCLSREPLSGHVSSQEGEPILTCRK